VGNFSIAREEPMASPEITLVGAGVELSCFRRRSDSTDAGQGMLEGEASPSPPAASERLGPERDSYPLTVTLVQTSTFHELARCEWFRSRLAARLAEDRRAAQERAQEFLEAEVERAEEELSQAEAAERDFAARKGSPEMLAQRQAELRRALDAARASGDRAREDRVGKQAIEVETDQIESHSLTTMVARLRAAVAVFRTRVEEQTDSGAPPAVEPCVSSRSEGPM
jgi:hypothetical protein